MMDLMIIRSYYIEIVTRICALNVLKYVRESKKFWHETFLQETANSKRNKIM